MGWVVLGVEYMLMCMAWGVTYVVGGYSVVAILSMAYMACRDRIQKLWPTGSVWYVGVCCEIVLLGEDMDCLLCRRLSSEQC